MLLQVDLYSLYFLSVSGFYLFQALDVGLKNYKMRSFIHFQCYNVVILTIYVFKNKSTKRIFCVLFFTKSLYLQALL